MSYSSEVQQLGLILRVKVLAQFPQRLSRGLGRDVRLHLHRHRDLAVTEDLHGDPGTHVEGSEQRPAGVTGVMQPDPAYASLGRPGSEGAVEVPRLDRRAVARGEHEVRACPQTARRPLGDLLRFLTELQGSLRSLPNQGSGGEPGCQPHSRYATEPQRPRSCPMPATRPSGPGRLYRFEGTRGPESRRRTSSPARAHKGAKKRPGRWWRRTAPRRWSRTARRGSWSRTRASTRRQRQAVAGCSDLLIIAACRPGVTIDRLATGQARPWDWT